MHKLNVSVDFGLLAVNSIHGVLLLRIDDPCWLYLQRYASHHQYQHLAAFLFFTKIVKPNKNNEQLLQVTR